jgi:hypothetical protein
LSIGGCFRVGPVDAFLDSTGQPRKRVIAFQVSSLNANN